MIFLCLGIIREAGKRRGQWQLICGYEMSQREKPWLGMINPALHSPLPRECKTRRTSWGSQGWEFLSQGFPLCVHWDPGKVPALPPWLICALWLPQKICKSTWAHLEKLGCLQESENWAWKSNYTSFYFHINDYAEELFKYVHMWVLRIHSPSVFHLFP